MHGSEMKSSVARGGVLCEPRAVVPWRGHIALGSVDEEQGSATGILWCPAHAWVGGCRLSPLPRACRRATGNVSGRGLSPKAGPSFRCCWSDKLRRFKTYPIPIGTRRASAWPALMPQRPLLLFFCRVCMRAMDGVEWVPLPLPVCESETAGSKCGVEGSVSVIQQSQSQSSTTPRAPRQASGLQQAALSVVLQTPSSIFKVFITPPPPSHPPHTPKPFRSRTKLKEQQDTSIVQPSPAPTPSR